MAVKVLVYSIFFNIVFVLSAFSQQSNSCVDFTQDDVGILNKNGYIPDGRFNSIKLTQGDRIQVYKPFYKGKEYMIIVSCDEQLPGIDVEITDMTRKLIYKSDSLLRRHEIKFVPEKNQNLIISVSVEKAKDNEILAKACVAVVVGFKM